MARSPSEGGVQISAGMGRGLLMSLCRMKQIGGGESEGSMHRLPFVHVEAQPAQFNIQDSGKTECSGEIAALESTRPGSLCVLKEAIPESKLT